MREIAAREAMIGCLGPCIWSLRGIEGCPSVEDVSRGCGVVGRFPRGEERAAAAGPAPEFRLVRQPQNCSLYAPLRYPCMQCALPAGTVYDHLAERLKWVSTGLTAGRHAWLHSVWAVRLAG